MATLYFHSRAQAGKILAEKLVGHAKENVAVVALSEGAIIVGAQIAMKIHANLFVLLSQDIFLPGEHDAVATMSSAGTFTYNEKMSPGEIENTVGEYNQYLNQERMNVSHQLNRLIGDNGEINKDYLRHHVVIVVSDGLPDGSSLEVAKEFLKSVAIKSLVVATPIASVSAVDKMHLFADEICCLGVAQSFIKTNHYYEDNTVPPLKDLFRVIQNISVNWER